MGDAFGQERTLKLYIAHEQSLHIYILYLSLTRMPLQMAFGYHSFMQNTNYVYFFVAQTIENEVFVYLVLSIPKANIITSYANIWVILYSIHAYD